MLGAMMVSESTIEPVCSTSAFTPRTSTATATARSTRRSSGSTRTPTRSTSSRSPRRSPSTASWRTSAAATWSPASRPRSRPPGNARHYAQIVKQNALMRRLDRRREARSSSRSSSATASRPWSRTPSASSFRSPTRSRPRTSARSATILHEEIDKLEKLASGDADITGTPSGFRDLDDKTGGFQPGNLIVIAARPSMGKSTLVCDIAENVAVKHDKPVALFSLEMSETELAHRFIASQARISSDRLRKGQVSDERLAEGGQGLQPARVERRSGSTTPPTSACSSCAPRHAACTPRSEPRQGRPRR